MTVRERSKSRLGSVQNDGWGAFRMTVGERSERRLEGATKPMKSCAMLTTATKNSRRKIRRLFAFVDIF